MNNFIKATIVGAAIFGTGIANAEWLNPEKGLEVDPRSITLPQYATGAMSVTECDECAPVNLVATQKTRYYVDSQIAPVSLSDLRSVFYSSTHDEQMIVYVYFDPNTMAVNRIVLDRSK